MDYRRKVIDMIALHAIESILPIIVIISLGLFLTYKNWFSDETSRSISKLVVNVSLPALMISNIMGSFDKNKFIQMAGGFLVPFSSIAICYFIAMAASNILKIKKGRKGTFESMFFNSNTIFIGLPVNMALFGSKSIPYVLLYYIANTTFFWTLGVYKISLDVPGSNHEKIFSLKTLKRIVSPPLLGFITAIILILLNIKLPLFVMDSCKYLGNLTTPLSMIFIGISIYSVKFKDIKFDRDLAGILLGRFVISPLTIFLMAYFIPIPDLMKKVFIIQSAMPVMTNTPIVAKAYGADSRYAAVMVTVTTVLSMITIPVFMMLLK